jgi:hypothetical protein
MGLKVPFRAARWAFWKVPFRSGKMGLKVPFRGGKMGQKFLSAAQRWVKSSFPRRKDGSKVPFRGGKISFLDRRKFLSGRKRWAYKIDLLVRGPPVHRPHRLHGDH